MMKNLALWGLWNIYAAMSLDIIGSAHGTWLVRWWASIFINPGLLIVKSLVTNLGVTLVEQQILSLKINIYNVERLFRSHCVNKSLSGDVTWYMATYFRVNIGSGDGMLLGGTKLLPDQMLTFTPEEFHIKWCGDRLYGIAS